MNSYEPISQPVFCILLALSLRERHGYEIMQQVQADSDGRITMGPGTLYGSIKKMLSDGLVEETDGQTAGSPRERRYYRLTSRGRSLLSSELARMSQTIKLAERRNLLGDLNRAYCV